MHLDVFLTPCALSDEDLEGRITVVIDVLRATTTITSALSAGARAVQPAADRQSVEHLVAQAKDESCLRAGERDGVKIDGYDLAAAVEPSGSVQRLCSIGHERDLPFCLQQDTHPLLPTYTDGEITLS